MPRGLANNRALVEAYARRKHPKFDQLNGEVMRHRCYLAERYLETVDPVVFELGRQQGLREADAVEVTSDPDAPMFPMPDVDGGQSRG